MKRDRTRLTRAESKQRTRDRLLDSAADVFARRGYFGASVEEIAEEAGYSRGAIYSNFAGKEEIFWALFDRRLERDTDIFFTSLTSPDDTQRYFDRANDEDQRWQLLQLEFFLYAAREPEAREKIAERFRAWRARFTDFLKQWLAERSLKPALSAEQLAWLISAMGNGLGLQALVSPEDVPAGIYTAAVEQLLTEAGGQRPYNRRRV